MEMRVHLGGWLIARQTVDEVPAIGSILRVTTEADKKDLPRASVIDVPITAKQPPEVYLGDIVVIDAKGYRLVQEGM
jgi:hypothetical protein